MFNALFTRFRPLRDVPVILLTAAVLPFGAQAADSCPESEQEALQWLDRMSRSGVHTAYHGVVTLQRGGEMQVMQVSHSINGDTTSEELTKLTGQGAQVVRTAHPLQCTHTGPSLLQLEHVMETGSCGLARYYRFQLSDGDRIAGRQAVRVRVEPRDMYRYGYLMELDQDTGLLLRSTTLGRGDLVLERFQFANLSYGAPLPVSDDIDVIHQAGHPAAETALDVTAAPTWEVSWLPKGFERAAALSGAGERVTYTDGLAAFSVFLEPLTRDIKPGEGVAREGSTTSYTRGLNLAGRPVLVTVIGEVPVNTARMVADSVHWTQ